MSFEEVLREASERSRELEQNYQERQRAKRDEMNEILLFYTKNKRKFRNSDEGLSNDYYQKPNLNKFDTTGYLTVTEIARKYNTSTSNVLRAITDSRKLSAVTHNNRYYVKEHDAHKYYSRLKRRK